MPDNLWTSADKEDAHHMAPTLWAIKKSIAEKNLVSIFKATPM
jgi:hypothetical protein